MISLAFNVVRLKFSIKSNDRRFRIALELRLSFDVYLFNIGYAPTQSLKSACGFRNSNQVATRKHTCAVL